ncbi:MAG: IS30 family transposase [Candidatus Daviesbacteria bacterium]|nr:IS30 family transposase [Candidatus Daviesbacteria bacterium]
MSHKHLNLEEREKFFAWKNQGVSLREIGRRLGRNHSTFVRESKRNRTGTGRVSNEYLSMKYLPCKAHEKALKRGAKQRQKAPLKNPQVFLFVRENLREGRTPDEIAGRLPIIHPGYSVSYETIYRYIYSKKMRRYKYWQYLTLGRKKRMKKNGRGVHRNSKIPGSISIDLRPEIVSSRSRVGDWETDNVIGKQTDKTALSVTVERVTRLTLLTRLSDRLAATKRAALIRRLGVFPKDLRLTLTTDNGSENSCHLQISEELELLMFFCHAYHSWEKGTVENMNGRIRRFIPKGKSIDDLTDEQIKEVERRLNSTPRKCLGYLTPYEKMDQVLSTLKTASGAFPL